MKRSAEFLSAAAALVVVGGLYLWARQSTSWNAQETGNIIGAIGQVRSLITGLLLPQDTQPHQPIMTFLYLPWSMAQQAFSLESWITFSNLALTWLWMVLVAMWAAPFAGAKRWGVALLVTLPMPILSEWMRAKQYLPFMVCLLAYLLLARGEESPRKRIAALATVSVGSLSFMLFGMLVVGAAMVHWLRGRSTWLDRLVLRWLPLWTLLCWHTVSAIDNNVDTTTRLYDDHIFNHGSTLHGLGEYLLAVCAAFGGWTGSELTWLHPLNALVGVACMAALVACLWQVRDRVPFELLLLGLFALLFVASSETFSLAGRDLGYYFAIRRIVPLIALALLVALAVARGAPQKVLILCLLLGTVSSIATLNRSPPQLQAHSWAELLGEVKGQGIDHLHLALEPSTFIWSSLLMNAYGMDEGFRLSTVPFPWSREHAQGPTITAHSPDSLPHDPQAALLVAYYHEDVLGYREMGTTKNDLAAASLEKRYAERSRWVFRNVDVVLYRPRSP